MVVQWIGYDVCRIDANSVSGIRDRGIVGASDMCVCEGELKPERVSCTSSQAGVRVRCGGSECSEK